MRRSAIRKADLPYPALNEKGDIVDLDWRKG